MYHMMNKHAELKYIDKILGLHIAFVAKHYISWRKQLPEQNLFLDILKIASEMPVPHSLGK